MHAMEISEAIDQDRRSFFGTAAITLAVAQLGLSGSAMARPGNAKPADLPAIKPGTNKTFASLKQIDAGVLNVGYEREVARTLVEEAEQLCPYSKATRGNIDVAINLV